MVFSRRLGAAAALVPGGITGSPQIASTQRQRVL